MGKRASLSTFAAAKPVAQPAPSPVTAPEKPEKPKKEELRGQTLRLSIPAWIQLKNLAIKRMVPSHDLLIEALNDLFQKHGEPPIA
jgi:hypothetical protein